MSNIINIYINNSIHIKNPPEWLVSFSKTRLTFANPVYEEAVFFGRYTRCIKKDIKLFGIGQDGTLEIPRGVLHEIIDLCAYHDFSVELVDETVKQENEILFGSVIQLREYQKDFVDKITKAGFGGIAVAPPGSGKTVAALETVARLKKRTLWLTHTSDLARQTRERAKEFLSNDKIGLIGSGKWKEGDLTIALVQTLLRRDLAEISQEYPLVIIDECHHVPSRSFTEIITRFNASTIIGLSATPYRKDGLEDIMFSVVGPQIANVEKKDLIEAGQIIPATVVQRHTGVTIDHKLVEYKDIMETLYSSDKRVTLVAGDVIVEASSDHICIVLVRTIDYGKKIFSALKKVGFDPSFVYSAESITIRGKTKRLKAMPAKERLENIQKFIGGDTNIMIATLKFLAEGFDYKPLDRLFIVNPISHRNKTLIEQACGRVERASPGKDGAKVFDYVDDHPLLLSQAKNREEIYRENLMSFHKSYINDYTLL